MCVVSSPCFQYFSFSYALQQWLHWSYKAMFDILCTDIDAFTNDTFIGIKVNYDEKRPCKDCFEIKFDQYNILKATN